MYRGVNDGFKVNAHSHLVPILATEIKVILESCAMCIKAMSIYMCSGHCFTTIFWPMKVNFIGTSNFLKMLIK